MYSVALTVQKLHHKPAPDTGDAILEVIVAAAFEVVYTSTKQDVNRGAVAALPSTQLFLIIGEE